MSTTNWLFYINFGIFSVFLTLFITELMGAVLLLLAYDRSKTRVLPHIIPIWEVTGTFAAFWVVTADFAYPSMLIPVASLLAGYLVVFLILLVARNASISFAEYIIKRRWLDEKKLYQTYAVSTLLIGVVVVLILSAIVSGAGVDLATLSFSLVGWLTNPGSLPYLVGVLVIGLGLAPVFYGIGELRRWTLPLTALGVAVEAGALYLYAASFLTAMFLVPALLTVLPAVLYQSRRTAPIVTNKVVFGAVSCLIIFSQTYLVYPTAFHGAISVDAVTTTGPMVNAFLVLSAAGVVIVGLLMALYLVVVTRSGPSTEGAAEASPTVAVRPRNL
jgi:cytochrome bd ubiquinol oxidase subunit II